MVVNQPGKSHWDAVASLLVAVLSAIIADLILSLGTLLSSLVGLALGFSLFVLLRNIGKSGQPNRHFEHRGEQKESKETTLRTRKNLAKQGGNWLEAKKVKLENEKQTHERHLAALRQERSNYNSSVKMLFQDLKTLANQLDISCSQNWHDVEVLDKREGINETYEISAPLQLRHASKYHELRPEAFRKFIVKEHLPAKTNKDVLEEAEKHVLYWGIRVYEGKYSERLGYVEFFESGRYRLLFAPKEEGGNWYMWDSWFYIFKTEDPGGLLKRLIRKATARDIIDSLF